MSLELMPLVPIVREGLDPVAQLTEARVAGPVVALPLLDNVPVWLVTGFAEVKEVLGDPGRFSNAFSNLERVGGGSLFTALDPGGLGFRDPPDHTRFRRLLAPEFSARRLARLQPPIDRIVEAHLDHMRAHGAPVDLVASFALPVPLLVVCDLLGVPEADRAAILAFSSGRFDFSGDAQAPLDAVHESLRYLVDLVGRERAHPGDGLLGMLIREHGDEVTDWELAGLADGLITGGHDTTASMLALGTIALLRNPELAALLRAGARVDDIVEELLRYLTVVQVAFPRFAKEDLVLGGQPIAAGDAVLCSLSGANRDPALGDDLDRAAEHRQLAAHLAFGHGIHHCVGAPLARMELRAAFPALLRRFESLRLALPDDEVPYRPLSIVYGVTSLPVAW